MENNKQAFAGEFVQRTRFTTAFPTTMTPAQFVDRLFGNAGVTPSATDRNAAINEFGGATNTTDAAARARALRRVAENSTLNIQEFNRAFVLMQYFGYLRRDPNSGPDTDYTGYDFWLSKLNQFNGNSKMRRWSRRLFPRASIDRGLDRELMNTRWLPLAVLTPDWMIRSLPLAVLTPNGCL